MKRSLLIILLVSTFSLLFAQREAPDVRHGNREYQKENYTEAEVNYRRALDKNEESFESYFNLGDALFRQEKYDLVDTFITFQVGKDILYLSRINITKCCVVVIISHKG